MIWFPNSAHSPDLEEPELFANSLQSIKQELAFSALVTKGSFYISQKTFYNNMSQVCINIAKHFIFTCLNRINIQGDYIYYERCTRRSSNYAIAQFVTCQVIVAIIVGALTGGIIGGLGISETINTFTTGLGNSAPIALSYAMLGGFAISLSKTGLPDAMIQTALKWIGNEQDTKNKFILKYLFYSLF